MQVPESAQSLFEKPVRFSDVYSPTYFWDNYEIIGEQFPYQIDIKENIVFGWDECRDLPILYPKNNKTFVKSHFRVEYSSIPENEICNLTVWEDSNPQCLYLELRSTSAGEQDTHPSGTWSGAMKLYYDDELLVTVNCPQITVE